MKAPVTTFNAWILKKIASYLTTKEGCNVERMEYTNDGARAILQDAFGYRYEIHIETLSRAYNNDPDASEAFVPKIDPQLKWEV